MPALPGWREHGLRHLLPQARIDCLLRYERPFWRERLPRIDLPLLARTGRWLAGLLGRETASKVGKALAAQ